MDKEKPFSPRNDAATPLPYFIAGDIQERQERLNNPIEAYLTDIEIGDLSHPEFTKQIVGQLPLFLAGICDSGSSFRTIISAPFIKEFIADDALVISSVAQKILADYFYIPKIWPSNDNPDSAYLHHLDLNDIEKYSEIFLDPDGLKDIDILKGLENTLKYFLVRAHFQSDIDFRDEVKLLKFLNKHNLDTSMYQSEEVKQLFLEKFSNAIRHRPFRIAGYDREAQTDAISIANFILGKDVKKIREHLIHALPQLLMEPASVWSLLNIEKILSYDEAKALLKFDFNRIEYSKAAGLASKAIKKARKYKKEYPWGNIDYTRIENILSELVQ